MPDRHPTTPFVLEAMRVPHRDDLEAWGALAGWLMGRADFHVAGPENSPDVDGLLVRTPEGTMLARIGDYVIQGDAGEFHVAATCQPTRDDDGAARLAADARDRLWLVYTGWQGNGAEGVLVEAATEDLARVAARNALVTWFEAEIASSPAGAWRTEEPRRRLAHLEQHHDDEWRGELVELPYIGEFG